MPKQAETKSRKTEPGNNLGFEAIAENGQRSLTAIAHIHSRAFRDAMKFNAELLDFTRRRIGANIEASDKLTRCESVTDAFDVMAGFYQGAVEDYTAESATLFQIGTEMATKSTEETVAEASRVAGGDKD